MIIEMFFLAFAGLLWYRICAYLTRKPVTVLMDYPHRAISRKWKDLKDAVERWHPSTKRDEIEYTRVLRQLPSYDLTIEQWIVVLRYDRGSAGDVEFESLDLIATSPTVELVDGLVLFPPTVHMFEPRLIKRNETGSPGLFDNLRQIDYSSFFPEVLGPPTRMFHGRSRVYCFEHPKDPRFENYIWFQEASGFTGGRIYAERIDPYEVHHWNPNLILNK
jgi:hypothetical protein